MGFLARARGECKCDEREGGKRKCDERERDGGDWDCQTNFLVISKVVRYGFESGPIC